MAKLKFMGEITLDDVFHQHEIEIFDRVLSAIEEIYKTNTKKIKVVDIEINDFNYSIDLSHTKFISALTNALKAFEVIEEYEKCNRCLTIINYLKTKTYI